MSLPLLKWIQSSNSNRFRDDEKELLTKRSFTTDPLHILSHYRNPSNTILFAFIIAICHCAVAVF